MDRVDDIQQNKDYADTPGKDRYNQGKVYVDVIVKFNKDGVVSPVRFVWEDGAVYDIDKVVNVKRAASVIAGGRGIMYTCVIGGRESHLYYEENNKWFMERR